MILLTFYRIELCKNNDAESVILFSTESIKKCQNVLRIRNEGQLKYSDRKIPSKINKSDGYHIECYRKFVALPLKHREKLKQIEDGGESTH